MKSVVRENLPEKLISEKKKKLALLVTYRVQHAFKCIMSEQQTWCYGMGDLARSLAGYQEGIKLEISALKVCGLTIILSSCPEVHFVKGGGRTY